MLAKKLTILHVAFLLSPVALLPQERVTVPVVIRVEDPAGDGISKAKVRVVLGAGEAAQDLETNELGIVKVGLIAGQHRLFVSAPGFASGSQTFDIGTTGNRQAGNQQVLAKLRIAEVSGPIAVYPADALVLKAEMYHPAVALSLTEFQALAHVAVKVHNGHSDKDESYSGVLLADLLAKVNAPMGKELRGEKMTTCVVATGADGYSVVLSLAEVDPDFHANQIMVADSRDGQPLGKNGPYQLIVPDDNRPARWVHNLNSISVVHAN